MSTFAQRQLEKMGWKAGEGLGKDGSGVKTFLKVEKRASGLVAGIGHEAGKSGSRVDDMGFDGALKAFHKPHIKKVMSKKAAKDDDDSSSSEEEQEVPKKKASKRAREEDDSDDVDADDEAERKRNSKKKVVAKKDSSSDDSSSDGDGEFTGGIQDIDDADLFKRCGGVRLGSRAGRHRFFTAKQKRCNMPVIEQESTKKVPKK